MIYLVTVESPADPTYHCDYTVEAADADAAKAFAEAHNPDLTAVSAVPEA